MNNLDIIVNAMGISYGIILILAALVRAPVIEAMRIDALFIPQPTESTRPINLIAGLLFAGYGIYSFLIK